LSVGESSVGKKAVCVQCVHTPEGSVEI